ncbi:hypothetical protein G7054_g8512 [Neopestalotiopsis clavispora]|nr:hypothetical protein G7054_g8512 [Neopestalotiopsis clavispora]
MGEEERERVGLSHIGTQPDTVPYSRWKDASNRECYSSFGDGGTTATVNASGDIMQLSKYIGHGHSGMFSADHQCVAEPYLVIKRTADLQNLIGQSSYDKKTTYGAHFPGLRSLFGPELAFVHNRWPRFDDVLDHDWQNIAERELLDIQDLDNLRTHLRSESSCSSKLSTSWVVIDGIVFQHCVVKNNSSNLTLDFDIQFEENMLIRDLDHLDPGYSSNKEINDNYFTFLGPQQQSWVRLHQFQQTQGGQNQKRRSNEEVTTGSVAVVVSVLIDNQLQSWSRTATNTAPDNETFPRQSDTQNNDSGAETLRDDGRPEERKNRWSHTLAPKKKVEITFAYQMYYTRDSQHEMRNSFGHVDKSLIEKARNILGGDHDPGMFNLASLFPITNEDVEILPENQSNHPNNLDGWSASRLEDPSGEISSMSPLNHLVYFTGRNLEHILSVCAIPIHSDDEGLKGLENLGVQPVALTCGDMAFHRVNTGASFFAFEFLIETARRLKQRSVADQEQAKSLLDRIQQVCIGHLLWLMSIAQETQPFAANYWVSGAKMDAMHTESWQPKDSPTDSAYQWIKIQECLNVFGHVLGEHKKDIKGRLEQSELKWREQLKLLDVKAVCAWPHAREDGTNIFRLDDHIWIWRGLRSLENIEESLQKPEDTINAWRNKTRKRAKEQKAHGSRSVQQKVIRHFTTRDEVLAKRTLAVTRSSRENRFLLHSRDTVLLYAYQWGFISAGDSNAMEVWKNAMRAQPEHEENDEFTWESALHYALSMLMALEGFSINKRPSSDMVQDSLAALTQSSSPNGLFPGLLDKTTKKDVMFHREADRDFYFHAGFEIPFILFTNAQKIIESWKPKTAPGQKSNEIDQKGLTRAIEHITQLITQQTLKDSLESNVAYAHENTRLQSQRSLLRTSRMKKSMPINLLIDAGNVVDVDDEWMYNYPGFLASEQTDALPFRLTVQKLRKSPILRGTPEELEWLNTIFGRLPNITTNSNPTRRTAAVFDIAKELKVEKVKAPKEAASLFDNTNKPRGEEEDKTPNGDPRMLDVEGLWKELCNPRTVESSKKRFVWLNSNEEDIALCCYLGSHDDEKPAISMFFDRNAKAEQFFHDETTRFLNTWETELHLSFYQLFSSHDSTSSGKGTLRGIDFTFPRNGGCTITKASIGFRFSGDFFDRFWTCHLIELTSEKRSKWDLWLKDPSDQHWISKHKAWRQRKVLELHLFERVLIALVDSTRELFKSLKKAVNLEGYGKEIFLINYKDVKYSESSGDWEDLQQSLKHISDELDRVDDMIVKWETREIDRGPERPRWTRSNETKYGGDINKLMVSSNHKVQEFRSLHLEIKSFREWLMRYQEQMRQDAAFRGSENIKFFTYVTVIFLPLGFASSVFSMSAVPEQDLVRRMVTMAIVALVITYLAIMSAPAIKSGFGQTMHKSGFSQALKHTLKLCKDSSILFRLNTRPAETEHATKVNAEDTHKESKQPSGIRQESIADEKASHLSSSDTSKGEEGSIKPGRQSYNHQHQGASDTWIWLWYIFTELPAQIVVSACDRMSRGDISIMTFFTVIIGIILLPWCFIALMAHIIIVNVADLVSMMSSTVLKQLLLHYLGDET